MGAVIIVRPDGIVGAIQASYDGLMGFTRDFLGGILLQRDSGPYHVNP